MCLGFGGLYDSQDGAAAKYPEALSLSAAGPCQGYLIELTIHPGPRPSSSPRVFPGTPLIRLVSLVLLRRYEAVAGENSINILFTVARLLDNSFPAALVTVIASYRYLFNITKFDASDIIVEGDLAAIHAALALTMCILHAGKYSSYAERPDPQGNPPHDGYAKRARPSQTATSVPAPGVGAGFTGFPRAVVPAGGAGRRCL